MADISKGTVTVLLVVAIIFSVVMTWTMITADPTVVITDSDMGRVSLTIEGDAQAPAATEPSSEGGTVSLNIVK